MDVLEHHKVGDQVTIEILRGNRREKLAVTLQAVN
jgi:S1-C subfamily serine protease